MQVLLQPFRRDFRYYLYIVMYAMYECNIRSEQLTEMARYLYARSGKFGKFGYANINVLFKRDFGICVLGK